MKTLVPHKANTSYYLDFDYVEDNGERRPVVHRDYVQVNGWLSVILLCQKCSGRFYLTPCSDRYQTEFVRYGSQADFCPSCDTPFDI
jgi:ribosomal protein L33